jgi:hypothetical protein
VVVEDPVVLAPDERGHRWRRHALQDGGAIDPEDLEVAKERLVVVELLVDVLLEVRGERRRERIRAVQLTRPRERRLGQRDGRADDLLLQDQVLGPELREARVLDQRGVRSSERGDEEIEFQPEPGAGRLAFRTDRAQ